MTEPKEAFDAVVKKPLYAYVGATDAVVQAVADVVAKVRERAAETDRDDVSEAVEGARERLSTLPADIQEQIEALRERLAGLPSELPDEIAELREKFTDEELRRAAEQYLKVAADLYAELATRGEEAVERLRNRSGVEEQIEKVEGFYKDAQERAEGIVGEARGRAGGFVGEARERAEGFVGEARDAAEDALGKVSDRTRAVGEQAAKLTGRAQAEVEETAEAAVAEAPVAEEPVAEAPVVEAPVAKAPAKKAPAKKAPAKKAPAKKAPAKKAPAKKAQP